VNSKQRKAFAAKLMDVANIAVGALVFGQFLSERGFRWSLTLAGLGLMALLYVISYFLLKFDDEKEVS